MKDWLWVFLLPLCVFANETVVESNEAHYNGQTITLIGDVIVENAMGRVSAKKAVLRRDAAGITKIDFPWIELISAVTLTLPNGNYLNCEYVFLDYTKMTSHCTGNPQIAYSDERTEVWADEAYVDYIEAEGSIQPVKVRLVNNVSLINLQCDQYALAERVTYYPKEQLMVLEGKENRVLFFDKQQNMQISAHTVRAKRNLETHKDSIQTVGNVRFMFGPEELCKLKERFQW